MPSVKIHKAKTELSRLIARVEAGEEIIITRGDRPVARLAPIASPAPSRTPGRLKGLITLDERFFEPLPDDALKAWEGGVNLLLDTHALIWWLEGSDRLSPPAQAAIADRANAVSVSAATAWEITTKHRLGKLPLSDVIVRDLQTHVQAEGFDLLDINFHHAALAGSLQQDHRDPFDRMLIAQALANGLTLVSNETLFDPFGVLRLW